jgi:signal transduction histidine kinase
LAVLAINAGQGERIAKDSSESAVMHEMRQELVRLSEDVHSLSHRLHPSILDDLGLEEALRAECDRFVAIDALDVEFEADGVPANVSSETALCLFRIAQEALRNVSRHAAASRVRLSLTRENDELHLIVEDNGRGFDPRRASGKASLGLVSMRQRASLVAGRIEIKGTEGGGTTVSASVPLEGKDHESSTRIAG